MDKFLFTTFFLVGLSLINVCGQTFTDISEQAGVDGWQTFGGHGGQFADVTNDGYPDLYVTNVCGRELLPDLFFINQKNNTFSEESQQRNVWDLAFEKRKARGIYGRGSQDAVWADLDNDGDYDLVNANTGPANRFYAALQINYRVPKRMAAAVAIYDMQGSLLKTFSVRTFTKQKNIIWRCGNFAGQRLHTGIYFVELRTKIKE